MVGGALRGEVMRRMMVVIDLHSAWKASGDVEARNRFNQEMNLFLGFLLDSFPENPSGEEFAKGFEAVNNDEPIERIPEAALPVYAMREIIKKHNIIFDVSIVTNWAEYTRRYGPYLFRRSR